MRWKLLIVASLAASVAGTGLFFGAASLLSAVYGQSRPPVWLGVAVLVLPLASITTAAIFVYRHTARRRKLQAGLTALLSLLLTVCALFAVVSYISNRIKHRPPELIYQHARPGS